MFNLINEIKEGVRLSILGEMYTVVSKVSYYTETEVKKWYIKVILTGHKILVIAPADDFMYFGEINNCFGNSSEFSESIVYNGLTYQKDVEDYQIVREIEFGNPLLVEGEVRYADYKNGDSDVFISLAWVFRTGKRADVIAQVISKEDVKVC